MLDTSLIRFGHLAGPNYAITKKKRQSTGCTTDSFYTHPKAGDSIDASQPVTITWDNTVGCITDGKTSINIGVYSSSGKLYEFTQVDYTQGSYTASLDPTWWETKSNVQLHFNILEDGAISVFSSIPTGPTFNATLTTEAIQAMGSTVLLGGGSTASATGSAASTTSTGAFHGSKLVNNFFSSGLPAGSLAAAVIMPILAIACAIGIYVFFSRRKEKVKRQRWSQAVDQRMSRISGDWKSMSAAGASAAIRSSFAAAGDRNTRASSFYGPGRPSSTFANEGRPDMQQIARPRAAGLAPDGTARVSRVSFAAESVYSRPSMGDSLRPTSNYATTSRASRAYHVAHPVPPLPPALRRSDTEEMAALEMSPTQTSGPFSLDNAAIEARVSGGSTSLGVHREEEDGRVSYDAEIAHLALPAMSLMHTGNTPTEENSDYMVSSPTEMSPPSGYSIAPYSATSPPATSMGMGLMPLMAMPTGITSPDDMLRAYASTHASGRVGGTTPSNGIASIPLPSMPAMPAPATGAGSSPDAALRAYAAARANTASTHSGTSTPPSTASNPLSSMARAMSTSRSPFGRSESITRSRSGSTHSGGSTGSNGAAPAAGAVPGAQTPIYAAMHTSGGASRTLYSPMMTQGLAAASKNPYRDSMADGGMSAVSRYSDEETRSIAGGAKWDVGVAE